LVETEIMNQLSYEVISEKIQRHGFITSDQLEKGINETTSLLYG